jgi:PPOX class probable F420-dependent enzyme
MLPFNDMQLAFLRSQRVGRLATADSSGTPHVVPVCYTCNEQAVYIVLDAKPKRVPPQHLKRVRNIVANPQVALVVDHYSEDWQELAFVLVHGSAALLLDADVEQHQAVNMLRAKYEQYQAMPIEGQPVIAIQPTSVVSWGALHSQPTAE